MVVELKAAVTNICSQSSDWIDSRTSQFEKNCFEVTKLVKLLGNLQGFVGLKYRLRDYIAQVVLGTHKSKWIRFLSTYVCNTVYVHT